MVIMMLLITSIIITNTHQLAVHITYAERKQVNEIETLNPIDYLVGMLNLGHIMNRACRKRKEKKWSERKENK